jgi:hypothetical protein
MELKVKIASDNAAFGEDEYDRACELGRILRRLAEALRNGRTAGKLRDINGNVVGSFEIS